MTSQPSDSKDTTTELSYIYSAPPPGSSDNVSTIVFLHGLESCHLEYSRVTPFLSNDYEIILVDLPGHSGSRDFLPFTFDNITPALSRLIKAKAKGGKAHIVGLSMGGFIGLEFARRCPELVLSLFCTGCAPPGGIRRWIMSKPRMLSLAVIFIAGLANERLYWWSFGVEPVPGLREEVLKNRRYPVLKAAYVASNEVTLERIAKIEGIRVAIVAGAKLDSVEDTKQAGEVLRSKNPASGGFVVRDAIHWWDLQFPELFAEGVRAWVENGEMPKRYEPLN